jgi:hypothetical protein
MDIVIRFDPNNGLQFYYSKDESMNLIHEISLKNLKSMSLSDLGYVVSTNLLAELVELRELFSDYLWSEDGEIAPKLSDEQPRE